MRINLISNINFTAVKQDYVAKIVKRDNSSGKYKDCDANIVEIDLNNKRDIKALRGWSKNWKKESIANDIYDCAKYIFRNKELNNGERKFYALTTQKNNFDNLNSDKILSVCQLSDINGKGYAYIDYFQSNYGSISPMYSEKYKNAGTGLMKFLQTVYDSLELVPANSEHTFNFYERTGFQPIEIEGNYGLRWEKEK